MSDLNILAKQMNKLMQKALTNMEMDESESMEVADMYPSWQSKLDSKLGLNAGEIVKYGVNSDNETQLYSVISAHTPQEDWTPDVSVSLFKAIGYTDTGVSIWTQPLGSTDAYQTGDIVSYNDVIYVSIVDNNVWQPDIYGWVINI